MNLFGLLSLLLAVSIGIVWTVASMGGSTVVDEAGVTQTDSTYQDALDAAHGAADTLSTEPSLSSRAVFVYAGISFPDDTTTVNLSGKGLIGSLKSEIRELTALEALDISDNEMTGIPAEIGQLAQLRVLNLSNNPFTGLPNELGNLQKLQTLDLRGTQYAAQDLAAIKAALPSSTNILVD